MQVVRCSLQVGAGDVFGMDEVVEHLGEVFAAGLFYIDGGGDFGDGGDGTEVGVEDDIFHQVLCGVGVGGRVGAIFGAGGGVARASGGDAAQIAGKGSAGGVDSVEEQTGALGVELVAGDKREDLGEGELDAGKIVEVGHFEVVGGGMDSTVAWAGAAGGVVVVAELLSAEGGRAAAAAGGVDVAAEVAFDGGFGEFGGVGRVVHEMPLRGG